ncbi:unnamed protein product, partial [Brenthis ino]
MDSNDNIETEATTLVNKFGLRDKVNFIVTDNAANIIKAVKGILGWKSFGCYAHTLNLIVQDALRLVKNDIDKVKRIVAHVKKARFHQRDCQNSKCNKATGKEPKRLSQTVDMRWNSTYFMLKRFVELEEAV